MNTAISICLILLLLVLIGAIITLTVYIVKWLIEFTLLTKTLNETTTLFKKEAEPILGELKETMTTINNLSKNIDGQVTSLKKTVLAAVGLVSVIAGKFKFLSGSFFKGFMSAFNLFRRK